MSTFSQTNSSKADSSFLVRDGLEMPGCAEQVPTQRAERPPGAMACGEARLRGAPVASSVASSLASEPRSRSSSLNSTDSGSGPQAALELGRGSPPTSQRFSVISSEDFDQELVVKPLKVRKKKRKKRAGTSGQQQGTRWCLPLLAAQGAPRPAPWAPPSGQQRGSSESTGFLPLAGSTRCTHVGLT